MKQRWMAVLLGVLGWAGTSGGGEGVPDGVWTLGRKKAGEEARYVFPVENRRKAGMRIEEVGVSCDCLSVEGWTEHIAAGGRGQVAIHYRAEVPGVVAHEAEVRGRDDNGEDFTLHYVLAGDVRRTRIDRTLCLDAEAISATLDDPFRLLVVDVREEEAFRKAHVPGAISLPLFTLKGKPFLRNRDVLVVDHGWDGEATEREVRRLRSEEGMTQLYCWVGGMPAWRDAGGKLEGEGPFDADQAPPDAMRDVEDSAEWLLVDATSSAKRQSNEAGKEKGNPPEGVLALPCEPGEKEAFGAEIDRILREEKPSVLFVLVGTEDGMDVADVEKIQSAEACGVFKLKGGWTGWREWVKLMETSQKMWKTQMERGQAKPTKCKGCRKGN